jgi:hypothetical protein
MTEIRFSVKAATTAKEALDCLQSAVMTLNAAHGNTLKLMLMAHDAGDERLKKVYSEDAAKLVEGMMRLGAVEMYLYNKDMDDQAKCPITQ